MKSTGFLKRYFEDSRYSQWRWAYIFLSVDLAWAVMFLFFPLALAIIFSLQDFSLANIGNISWVGFANYERILTDTRGWWHSVRVTAIWTLFTVPVNVAIAMGLSLLIVPLRDGPANFFKGAFYLPAVVSQVVISVIMVWIFSPRGGLANMLLNGVGLPSQRWYASPELALFTLMLMTWITGHGFGILLYTAALKRIPTSLYEAAEIDSTPAWKKFWNITWPLIKPTTLYVTIINLIASFQTFAGAFFITKGGPLRSTEFVNWRIYTTFYQDGNFGLASAMAVVLMVVIMMISLASFKLLGTDVEY